MCAGDLGMYRVMPWSYPPISGGSSGGFSPDDSGGGSGSGGSHFLVKTDETVLQFTQGGPIYNSNLQLTVQIQNGKFGFGDLRGIESVWMYGTVKEIILKDGESNVTNLLKTDVKNTNVDLRNLQNNIGINSFRYDFNVDPLPGSSGDITPKKVVFGIKYEAHNADGAVVDTVTFPDLVFES